MIRSALIAIGLSVGAQSAQGCVVPLATQEICDESVSALATDDVAEAVGATEQDPVEPQSDAAPQLNKITLRIKAALSDKDGARGISSYATAAVTCTLSQEIVLLSDLNIASPPAADGSDPSADFCP